MFEKLEILLFVFPWFQPQYSESVSSLSDQEDHLSHSLAWQCVLESLSQCQVRVSWLRDWGRGGGVRDKALGRGMLETGELPAVATTHVWTLDLVDLEAGGLTADCCCTWLPDTSCSHCSWWRMCSCWSPGDDWAELIRWSWLEQHTSVVTAPLLCPHHHLSPASLVTHEWLTNSSTNWRLQILWGLLLQSNNNIWLLHKMLVWLVWPVTMSPLTSDLCSPCSGPGHLWLQSLLILQHTTLHHHTSSGVNIRQH